MHEIALKIIKISLMIMNMMQSIQQEVQRMSKEKTEKKEIIVKAIKQTATETNEAKEEK